MFWVHLIFANILVGAKYFGSKYLILTNKLSVEMLRPCKIEMHPMFFINLIFQYKFEISIRSKF